MKNTSSRIGCYSSKNNMSGKIALINATMLLANIISLTVMSFIPSRDLTVN